jgi:hypothetical protein
MFDYSFSMFEYIRIFLFTKFEKTPAPMMLSFVSELLDTPDYYDSVDLLHR